MKLGLGLYKHMLTTDNYRFAKQAGCTHIVAHLADYFNNADVLPGTDAKNNWGAAKSNDEIWSYENLKSLKNSIKEEGLDLYAIENFSPADWYDVLLDGPKKKEQMENLKNIIKNVGKAGIPVFGYNFSIAGVWGHIRQEVARGGALTVTFQGQDASLQPPVPNGEIWNMTYNPNAPEGNIGNVTSQELWRRLEYFLKEILPVAEEYGVKMAAHPDDPPMPELRGTSRLVYQPQLYQRLLDLVPSKSNNLEFCMGSIQEMSEGNIYDAIEQYCSQDKIAYVHFRNVVGKVPNYREVFVDEGDIDMLKTLRIYKKYNYDGVFIPDHTPQMTCEGPWNAGMAYALGYMKAAMDAVEKEL